MIVQWLLSFNAAVGDRIPEGEIWDRLFSSDCETSVENQWGEGRARKPNYLFCSLECLNCWGVGCGGVRHKVLFRAIWKHIFLIPGFENVSPGDGTDWLKETHCVSWELTKKIRFKKKFASCKQMFNIRKMSPLLLRINLPQIFTIYDI